MTSLKDILARKGTPTDCTAIVLARGRAFVCGLRHYTPDKWKQISVWTTPGGRCDPGETLERALRRETLEETGIKSFDITGFLGSFDSLKAGDRVHYFVGTTAEEPRVCEPDKFSEWRWMDVDAIPENFVNPVGLAHIHSYFSR